MRPLEKKQATFNNPDHLPRTLSRGNVGMAERSVNLLCSLLSLLVSAPFERFGNDLGSSSYPMEVSGLKIFELRL